MDTRTPFDIEHISELFRLAQSAETPPSNLVGLDFDKLSIFFEGSGLSEAEIIEVIMALKDILQPFVDMGFGVHPVQCVSDEFPEKFIDREAIKPDNKTHSNTSIAKELDKAARNTAAERQDS